MFCFRSVFKPFIFCSNNKITGLTESPKGHLGPGERKHDLWRAVEGGNGGEGEVQELERWCLESGDLERRKPFSEIENGFNKAVEKEMKLRQC